MRLWHKDLITVLPSMQLKGQWRECCLIAKALHDGNLNHILVNRVKDYPEDEFNAYADAVAEEMTKREYKVDTWKFFKWRNDINSVLLSITFRGWHDNRYLRQCLYNLEEKAMAGGIPADEWRKIYNAYGKQFDLWGGNE